MRRTRILTALALTLTLGLAACGQDGDDDGVATLSEDTPGTSADDDVPDDVDEQVAKFEECMDDNGIDMEEQGMISGPAGPMVEAEEGSSSSDEQNQPDPAEQEAFEGALQECEKYMPTPELSPEDEAELRENALAYTECLREKGFDMPDPKIEGGGMALSLDEDGGIDPDDPAFRAADEECIDQHLGVAETQTVPENDQ